MVIVDEFGRRVRVTPPGSGTSMRKVLKIKEGGANADDVRDALVAGEFPQKMRDALGCSSLELDSHGWFVVYSKEHGSVRWGALSSMLQKNSLPGWTEWLQGRRGWCMATGTHKQPHLDFCRDLHEAYSVTIRALLKNSNPDLKRRLAAIYYKQDPLTYENGFSQERQNTQTLWKKASEKESLQDAVVKIRPFLEVLRYFCTDPKEKWTTLPWLFPSIAQKGCKMRLERISRFVRELMRSSDLGPDNPVQWAAHPPLNHYPRSTITNSTMNELVVGLANILSHLFLLHPVIVRNLDEVDKTLSALKSTTSSTAESVEPLSSEFSGLAISNK